MRILELTNYSKGICGVFQRVKQESIELSNLGHEVIIFSSDKTKGSKEIASCDDKIGNIKIKRFSSKQLGGESFLYWSFIKEAVKFNPDIVIAHAYRHIHTTAALRLKKKLGCKVFLVTHAPFIEKNSTRSTLGKISVNIYDSLFGKRFLNQFDRVITITHWENKYLDKLGLNKNKIIYIPNGIPKEFFKEKVKSFKGKNILFLGRISPIKNLEVLIKAISLLKNKNVKLKIIGPIEEPYGAKLVKQIKYLNIDDKIEFLPPVYDLSEKIKTMQQADIFVLPSLREAMPQSLIEAMSLGKIVIASKTEGAKEIINDNKNGLLFNIDNAEELKSKISFCLDKKNILRVNNIKKQSREDSRKYSWETLISKLNKLIIK